MGLFSKLDRSTQLVAGMAERLGADLDSPVSRDPERAAQAYRAMVLRCTKCSDPVACTRLQAEHDHLDQAPSYCLNGEILSPSQE